jgi:hypothetical protein
MKKKIKSCDVRREISEMVVDKRRYDQAKDGGSDKTGQRCNIEPYGHQEESHSLTLIPKQARPRTEKRLVE